ncbi:MAG: DUF5723 family protein [Salinivirgaceae bacterium]
MKINKIAVFFLLLGSCIGFSGQAQQIISLYYLENIPQVQGINPAMAPRAKGYIGIPFANSTYVGINTDMIGSELIQNSNGRDFSLLDSSYNYAPFYKRIGKAANFSAYQTIVPIQFGFSGEKGYFSFSWSEKLNQSIAIPKDFFAVMDNGGFPDGSKYDFSPFAINAQYYRELSFGYSYNFMSKLRIGFHAKLLQGLAAIKTDIETFDLKTGLDKWDLALKGTVYSSSPVEILTDSTGFPSDIGEVSTDIKDLIDMGLLNFSNPGIAADFGVDYEHNEAWTFSAALNDVGFISWKGNLKSFSADGAFTFNGLNLNANNIDSLDLVLEELTDSIKNVVNIEQGTKSFRTGLGPKLYVGTKYNVNHYFYLGALSRTQFAKNDFQQEFNVSANLNLYHFLTTTLNYTYSINGANTVGFGLALRGGPLQFYMAMDYLPYAYRSYSIQTSSNDAQGNPVLGDPMKIPIAPTTLDNFNVVFGLNILFGANGFRDEPMIETDARF